MSQSNPIFRSILLVASAVCFCAIIPSSITIAAETDAKHWFFQAPVKVEPPIVPGFELFATPIDRFIAADWKNRGLAPGPIADRGILLRRLYLDLIGLPPLPAEIAAFEADRSPEAYGRVVDRLLADPRYGQRWGRQFMDIWRYSDEMLNPCDHVTAMIGDYHMWRWRDWIVESLNGNKPYDRMIQEMLAADELAPDDANARRATGYLVRNYNALSGRDAWLADTVEHTAQAFLGLTMRCCRCHDHKYDPLSQADYYRMRAIFEPMGERLDFLPGSVNPRAKGMACVFDENPEATTVLYIAGNPQQRDLKTKIVPGVPAMLHAGEIEPAPVLLRSDVCRPGQRPFVRADRLDAVQLAMGLARAEVAKLPPTTQPENPSMAAQRKSAAARLSKAESELAAVKACIAADDERAEHGDESVFLAGEATEAQRLFERREAELAIAEAAQNAPQKLDEAKIKLAKLLEAQARPATEYKSIWTEYPDHSSGRRLAFARWMTSRRNPATARVLVNHLWMRHFGQPLVDTVFDFGVHGHQPTHPALLDWLAVEFMEGGWDLKHLHRLMVMSAAYQLASAHQPGSDNERIDPENRYLWRMNPQRMQAEEIRDSVIYLSGKLDCAPDGPSIDPNQSDRVFRRSLYFQHTLDRGDRLMQAFDAADPNECYRRIESIVPQQALTMANSRLTFEHARLIARSLSAIHSEDADFLAAAFEQVICRPPTDGESAACLAFMKNAMIPSDEKVVVEEKDPLAAASIDARQRARDRLVQVLLNHTDFLTIR